MSSQSVDYLITGATGGLGASIARHLITRVPASSIALASTNPDRAAELQELYPGTQFRQIDYKDEHVLADRLSGVKKFFMVSTDEFDSVKRSREQANAVKAAKAAGVEHTYYSSLAFGGFEDTSSELMKAHIETEKRLKESGIPYTSIRVGLYAEAFPLYLSWYPHSREVYIPTVDGTPLDGPVAWAKRDELGEAIAILLSRQEAPSFAKTNNIALLSGPAAYTVAETAAVLSVATADSPTSDEKPEVKYVPADEYPEFMEKFDQAEKRGHKPASFYKLWLETAHAIHRGEGALVDPLLEELLGRKPTDGLEYIRSLVEEGGESGKGFLWHQNKGSV